MTINPMRVSKEQREEIYKYVERLLGRSLGEYERIVISEKVRECIMLNTEVYKLEVMALEAKLERRDKRIRGLKKA